MMLSRTRLAASALALLGFCTNAVQGQPLSFSSAVRFGGAGNDQGEKLFVDAAGNLYVTGTHSGPVDFDAGPGVTTIGQAGPFNAFVAKYAPSGALLWARNHVAGVSNGFAITVDAAGNVYTAGWFSGANDFDPGPGTFTLTSVGGVNMFVSKLDSSGNFIWAKGMFGGTATPGSMATDAGGNLYISGHVFMGTVDFDPGPGTVNIAASNQLFVCKLDASGNFVFALNFPGTNGLNGNGLALDAAANLYATATLTAMNVDLDPGPGVATFSSGNADPILLKLDAAGNFIWAKQFIGGIGAGFGTGIATDNAGNVFITGQFLGTVDFDPGPGVSNLTAQSVLYDNYTAKLSGAGTLMWARRMGGNGLVVKSAVAVDGAGNVYTVGHFPGTADFDPGPATFNLTSAGMDDIFVSILDSNGSFIAAGSIGAANNDQANHVAVSPTGIFYVTGFFELTADFNPGPGVLNLTSAGGQDIFVIGLQGGPGSASPIAPGPSGPEGSFTGSVGGKGTEGSFGLGARQLLSEPPRRDRPVLFGPFAAGPGEWRVCHISPRPPADEAVAESRLLESLLVGTAAALALAVLVAKR